MSNRGIDVDALLVHWVPYVVGQRDSITVAMDWTEFDADGQATIMLSLLSRHGRATPLVWLTVDKAALKNRRNGYEYQVLVRLAEILPADVRVRIVADRGFGDHKLYRVLSEELKFDFVIRFRGYIAVTATDGETRAAADWVGAGGRARTLRGAAVTAQKNEVVDHDSEFTRHNVEAIDTRRQFRRMLAAFVVGVNAVMRVGEPDRAVAMHNNVVWAIQAFAVVMFRQNGHAAVQFGAGDTPVLVRTADQTALTVACVAVGKTGRLTENEHAAVLGPAQDAVVRQIAYQQLVCIGKPDGSFQPGKILSERQQLCIGQDERAKARINDLVLVHVCYLA